MDMREDELDSEYSSGPGFTRLASEFENLRQLPLDKRAAALASLETKEPGLTTALRRLFEQHSEDPNELCSPGRVVSPDDLVAAIAGLEDPSEQPEQPNTIGPYRVLRALGRGGMGVVYLAERDDADFKKLVAIKLLRAAIDDGNMQHRFRTERRILAALEHPNIAAMFDGGTNETGQPYVVMEYVDGTNLLEHCEKRCPLLRDRLAIFVKVCRAVAHAHRALVVHRDLKPGNILVTRDGTPKLLDFGIAKLLHEGDAPHSGDDLAVTATGSMLLTPEYSSPEQVRGENITTATDVYSLGTILYELLSGHRAQTLPNRSLSALVEIVCDRIPPAPSLVAGQASVRRQLRGDLDTIVAYAMRKEADRRYESAAALADDIEHFLAGLPVAAQRDTLGYRARKFVGRHTAAVLATTALLVLVIAFAVTTAMQNQLITIERDAAVTQRVVANEISEFLVDLFLMASPDPERAETLRARELLDRGARRIDTELTAFPERRAPLKLTMGRTYLQLGLYDAARPLIEDAETTYSHQSPNSLGYRNAQYWRGVLELHQGHLAQGEQLILASMQPHSSGPIDTPALISRKLTLESWLRDAGRFDEAWKLLDEVEQLATGTKPGSSSEGQDLSVARAEILRDRGEPRKALPLLLEVKERAMKNGDYDHPRFLPLQQALGNTYKALGDLDDARIAFDMLLSMTRKFTGDSHPDVDNALFSQAMLEVDLGDFERAETMLREILARDIARFGPHHAFVGQDKAQLASVLGQLEKNEEAETLFLEGLALQRELLPADHPELPTTIANLGTFYQRNRRPQEAKPLFEEAFALRRRLFRDDDARVLTSRNQLAVVQLEMGELPEAEQALRAVLEARQRTLGTSSETAGSFLGLATAIYRQDRDAESIPLFEQSIAMFDATLPADHPTRARPRIGIALAHLRLHHPELAEPFLREAVKINRDAYGDSHTDTFYAELQLAKALAAQKKAAEAKTLLQDLERRILKTQPSYRFLSELRELLKSLETGK
jgi:eukaryotic-like serine/threonine-protein kinase